MSLGLTMALNICPECQIDQCKHQNVLKLQWKQIKTDCGKSIAGLSLPSLTSNMIKMSVKSDVVRKELQRSVVLI